MSPAPRRIGGLHLVLDSPIDGRHTHSGARTHVVGGVPWAPAAGLAICRYEDHASCYRFGCDSVWSNLTDTWHQSLEDAMSQPEAVYPGSSQTWHRPA